MVKRGVFKPRLIVRAKSSPEARPGAMVVRWVTAQICGHVGWLENNINCNYYFKCLHFNSDKINIML